MSPELVWEVVKNAYYLDERVKSMTRSQNEEHAIPGISESGEPCGGPGRGSYGCQEISECPQNSHTFPKNLVYFFRIISFLLIILSIAYSFKEPIPAYWLGMLYILHCQLFVKLQLCFFNFDQVSGLSWIPVLNVVYIALKVLTKKIKEHRIGFPAILSLIISSIIIVVLAALSPFVIEKTIKKNIMFTMGYFGIFICYEFWLYFASNTVRLLFYHITIELIHFALFFSFFYHSRIFFVFFFFYQLVSLHIVSKLYSKQ